ncbi:fibroleukin-like [Anopheles cruzii]|uniref:fibroleukin-like n=1 Tax=Anopheles cruzii TaxID=68878 RepID=UPI0022EC6F6B|nr:fibroleukin-like [Anopheles cruzii]
MGTLGWIVFLCIASSARSDDTFYNETASATPTIGSLFGYAFEMLMAKLDHMPQSVLQLQIELAKQREEVAESKAHMTVGLDQMQHSFLELQTELAKHREEAARSQADTKEHMTVGLDQMQQSFLELQNELAKHREEVAQSQNDSKAHMTVGLDQMQHSFLELQTELAKHREEAARSQADTKEHMTVGLDQMQQSFLELQNELAKQWKEAARSQNNSDKSLVDIKRAVQNNFDSMRQWEDDVGRNFTLLQDRSWQILTQILTRVTTKTNPLSHLPFRSCSDIWNEQSGAYIIQVNDESNPFMAYCHRDMKGKGIWLVIQHRFDGSLNFYRNWTEYRNGFGDIEKEFWIGLERLYQLTSGRPHELMVELRNSNGTYKFALYTAFEIGSETEQYNLKTLGEYNGTAGDSLSQHKNMKFSTFDRDNDLGNGNCAESFESAWWYNDCYHSNLNGRYKDIDKRNLNNWNTFTREGLAFSRMMIRPKE